jgi:hypothetical protein
VSQDGSRQWTAGRSLERGQSDVPYHRERPGRHPCRAGDLSVSHRDRLLAVDARAARARAADAGVELDLREGDMRQLKLDEPASLIYCPYRALLHLPTWADRRRTFERVAASLRPGGRFAWNAFALDHRIAVQLEGQHNEPEPHTIRYAVGDNRVDITLDDGATTSLWWATKNEWLGLLDVAGLQLEALLGDFDREPVGDDSSEYVFVARR